MENLKTVLIIDDDPIQKVLIGKYAELKKHQVNVILKLNGEEGLKFLTEQKESPILIFLDILMPIMDGFKFCDYIEESGIEIHGLYILTASVSPLDINKAKNYPFVKGFISKPLRMDHFDELIKKELKIEKS